MKTTHTVKLDYKQYPKMNQRVWLEGLIDFLKELDFNPVIVQNSIGKITHIICTY